MLINFSVENYRSIRERVTLATCAQFRKRRSDPSQPGYYSSAWRMRLLPAIAIFGPNSAGKSNVISALSNYFSIARRGGVATPGLELNQVVPYCLDGGESNKKPIKFSAEFLIEEHRYRYEYWIQDREIRFEEFAVRANRSADESLIFTRRTEKDGITWDWGHRGKFALHQEHRAASNNLNRNRLFLSVLAGAYTLESFGKFWGFIQGNPLPFDSRNQQLHADLLVELMKSDPDFRRDSATFLSIFGIPNRLEVANNKIRVLQKNSWGESRFALEEESDGTRQLITLAETIIHGLKVGGVVMIDELDAHLHPLLSHQLIELFQNPSMNKNHAQLIFSTHDTTLMDLSLLRKEQIYLITREKNEGTRIESVADYKLRNQFALARNYMEGRLSGLPNLDYENQVIKKMSEILVTNDSSRH